MVSTPPYLLRTTPLKATPTVGTGHRAYILSTGVAVRRLGFAWVQVGHVVSMTSSNSNHCPYLIPKPFFIPQKEPAPISNHSLFLPNPSSWQSLIYLLFLRICLS